MRVIAPSTPRIARPTQQPFLTLVPCPAGAHAGSGNWYKPPVALAGPPRPNAECTSLTRTHTTSHTLSLRSPHCSPHHTSLCPDVTSPERPRKSAVSHPHPHPHPVPGTRKRFSAAEVRCLSGNGFLTFLRRVRRVVPARSLLAWTPRFFSFLFWGVAWR